MDIIKNKKIITTFIIIFFIIGLIGIKVDGLARTLQEEKKFMDQFQWVVPLGEYEHIKAFDYKQGIFAITKYWKYGIINSNNEELVPCIYDYIDTTADSDLILVRNGERIGYINEDGTSVLNLLYDSGCKFVGKYASVEIKGKNFIIDKEGNTILDVEATLGNQITYNKIESSKENSQLGVGGTKEDNIMLRPTEKEGIYYFYNNGNVGFVDVETAKIVMPATNKYQTYIDYSEGFFLMRSDIPDHRLKDINIFLDENFQEVFKDKLIARCHYGFKEGYVPVELVEDSEGITVSYDYDTSKAIYRKNAYMDKEGNLLEIDSEISEGNSFSEGLALVSGTGSDSKEKDMIIDKEGKIIVEIPYRNFSFACEFFSEGLMPYAVKTESGVNMNNEVPSSIAGAKFGYIDKTGKFVVEPIFDGVAAVKGGLAVVQYNQQYGIIKVK